MAASISVEVGNGEESFIGLKIKPGIKYNLLMKTSVCLANVMLDPNTAGKKPRDCLANDTESDSNEEGDRRGMENMGLQMIKNGIDCVLHRIEEQDLQFRLGFSFPEGSQVTFYVKGNATYYICGYKTSVDYSL